MRFLTSLIFILFNFRLIESVNEIVSENSHPGFESENSELVPGDAQKRSDDREEVLYDEYDYDDSKENYISGKTEMPKENSTESAESMNGFPDEVFVSLRNITADAATAFRSFTNRNDVVDLQASASDNLNVTVNNTFEGAESEGINMRALRDAEHSPQIIDEGGGEAILLPYKHTKIDTADLSDCALQGEWKPMGVAHGHLHVGGDQPNVHQAEILQSVGSFAVPNKIIPYWQQKQLPGSSGNLQVGGYNHKPSGLYASGTGGASYGSGFGYGSGSGFPSGGVSGINSGTNHYHGGSGGFAGLGLGQMQKIKSGSMLSPPPVPPIIFGKKPGYWKLPKTKHKFFPGKGRRPGGGYSGAGSYGFSSQLNHGVNTGLGSGHGYGNGGGYSGSYMSGYLGHGGGGVLMTGTSGHLHHGGEDGKSGLINHIMKGGSGGGSLSGYGSGSNGGLLFSGGNHKGHGFEGESGNGFSTSVGSHSFGVGTNGEYSSSEGVGHKFENGASEYSTSGSPGHSNSGFGGGSSGVLSISESSTNLGHLNHGLGGGAVTGQSIGGSGVLSGHSDPDLETGVEEELSGGHRYSSGNQIISGLISGSGVGSTGGDKATAVLVHSSGNGLSGKHLMSLSHGAVGGDSLLPEAAFLSTQLKQPSESVGQFSDSSFSSTHVTQGLRGGNSLPAAAFVSSHINQDFSVHGQGVSDDLSSSTFTCGKNHDHSTNYHTATFQVADHDHPSSVDVLQYGGDSAVLIQSGDASFHDQIRPERKLYKTSHLSDAEISGSDNRNELTSQTAKLTSSLNEQDGVQTEVEAAKLDDGEEPERHSYYREITKVTKIPATSVGSVQYTFSQYETKPQTFSTESDIPQDEPEAEQPQIIRELEHLSNKFQLDLNNPQKLFEDPPTQELVYHYPFQDDEHQDAGKSEGTKEENHEGVTEFPYQYYHNNADKIPQYPVVYKKPTVKYFPRPGKPHFYQKNTINYLQPKTPLVVIRKPKPKQFLKKKQNYEVHEHSGERHRPIGEIFPPQKSPKQFHNPKPNFAVDRPKNGWRPEVHQYKYDYSHGKKVRKFKTKAKVVGPILIRRPVSPAPVIRVVEVSG